MSNQNSLCVGIDLGTTNSLIATCRYENGKITTPVKSVARIVDGKGVKRNDQLLPSFVYYPQQSGSNTSAPCVGDFAKERYVSVPFRVAKSIKSQMGKPFVTGLQDDIQDKTPEEVSAKILSHLIRDLEKHYDEKIDDVVITVPASFDPAQRLATLRAAELAGINVRNDDNSYNQDILLSEPEAVMYNVMNQIKKGEYDVNLNFDEPKTVLVYDIGGGTLDITLNYIKKNSENPEVLDMDMLATNRFTPVAGDAFDKAVAEKMYKQYLDTYRKQMPQAAVAIEQKKEMVMSTLQEYAESLKIAVNSRYEDAADRGNVLSDSAEFECGGAMPNGYTYDGYFTKKEYEESVKSLLGLPYNYDDYKTIEGHRQTEDIIWPVLDVLRKGAKKLQRENIVVDAVVMSGGMSRLYLIKNRLEDFFGFHVICVSDPDKAVVQGAVVYHFHQHQDSELMKKLHAKEHTEINEKTLSPLDNIGVNYKDNFSQREEKTFCPSGFVKMGKSVLADAIYLGLKGGANQLIADEGQDLPYTSAHVTGFKVEKGQNTIYVPIRKKGIRADEYITIASGIIKFDKMPKEDVPVELTFGITKSQIITIEATICWQKMINDAGDEIVLTEKGSVTFSFSGEERTAVKGQNSKILPPPGTRLVAVNELSSLCELCLKNAKCQTRVVQAKIKQKKQIISSCGNPEDFAEPMLKVLKNNYGNPYVSLHIIPLARKMSKYWSPEQQKRLVKICLEIIAPRLQRIFTITRSIATSVCNEAILTVGMLGTRENAEKMLPLSNESSHTSALLHAFALHGLNVEWIQEQLFSNVSEAYRWIGLAVSKASSLNRSVDLRRTVEYLIDSFDRGSTIHNDNMIIHSIISLGLICDRRGTAKASDTLCEKAEKAIRDIGVAAPESPIAPWLRPQTIALKLISGETLDSLDEQYLLSRFEE